MTTPPADVPGVRVAVDALLDRHLADLAAELAALGEACDPLVATLRDTLSGGKRLRAAFCYWSWRAHADPREDDPGHERALRIGAALELFHAAALLHDDVMDASDTRRGLPAAHRVFESLHRTHGWRGDGARFGVAGAILLGDLALITSERELTDAVGDLDAARRSAVRAIFDEMRTEVTAGQYLDVLAEVVPWGEPVAEEPAARTVVRAKSARYSVEHPLSLGAALAGANDAAMRTLRAVGLPLGEAFQLRDDLLGVFGDPATTGKPAGDDLREGKRTVLALRGLAAAGPEDAATLRRGLGRADLSTSEVEALRTILRSTGAVDSVERLIDDLAGPALAALAEAELAEPARTVLLGLGRAAVQRSA
ncbi:polyprenyl synthetase family protein [Actinotalea sp. M2MS4P-6]|uniref:polyprenyl synthetase family protein n=1 Tax=Actinotalea sp. M2MS4P-6 TaxID=2983762 RepID=UPI0021E3CB27|nr:polyprenyl synthetase family protein [Actinotalea sp. M2MS4P-6]MCV2396472.1 polyprenyl synthetase family protein [Actinotalea sp. M2MS4P-6]